VEVSTFSGRVDINTVDGDTAIVQIERMARSRAELDCNKVIVDQFSGNLTVKSETIGGPGCDNIQVVHRVLLSLPRHVNVSIHGVSGSINIGEIEGVLHISGNSGNINLAQVGSGSRITGNGGPITIKLRKLNAGGLELSGNSGAINLYVDEKLSVDVKVTGQSCTASSELPNLQFQKTGAADYYARIGSGGPTINLSGNSGSILLVRLRE
jgi:hypothetical protein